MLKQKDRSIIQKTYDHYAPQFSMAPRVSLDGLCTTPELVAKKRNADVQAMLDESLLEKLQKEGFLNKFKP